jgi:hypothetical protein
MPRYFDPSPGGDRVTSLLDPIRDGRLWEGVSRATVIRRFTAKEYAASAKDTRPRPYAYYDGKPVRYSADVVVAAGTYPAKPRRKSRAILKKAA